MTRKDEEESSVSHSFTLTLFQVHFVCSTLLWVGPSIDKINIQTSTDLHIELIHFFSFSSFARCACFRSNKFLILSLLLYRKRPFAHSRSTIVILQWEQVREVMVSFLSIPLLSIGILQTWLKNHSTSSNRKTSPTCWIPPSLIVHLDNTFWTQYDYQTDEKD